MYKFFKRLMDIVFGLIGVVILIPITVIVKLVYICTGDFHSVFFLQPRIGRDGKEFMLIKYRSMILGAEDELKRLMAENPKIREEYTKNKKLRDDPRITKAGKVIRRLSIDELPQLINVLFGQMSLVGNRPYLVSEKREMGKYYERIVQVRPGLTGLWQVSGHNDVPFKSRLELEATYSDIMSFAVDTRIVFKTFRAVIVGGNGGK